MYFKPINPLFITDFYKTGHIDQYPDGTEVIYSNFTPRFSKYSNVGETDVVVAGITNFVKVFLHDYWNENFFNRPKEEVIKEYQEEISLALNLPTVRQDHIEYLHDLGYLPISLEALPEGTSVAHKIPVVRLVNTDPNCFWITNYLETVLSTELWKPMTSATTAKWYKTLLTYMAKKTNPEAIDFVDFQAHDFSMRGLSGWQYAALNGVSHLMFFKGTDTISSIPLIRSLYGDTGFICGSVPATEHSVMCAGSKENELETYTRLLTKVYPEGVVSIVSDTWDYWGVLGETLPQIKDLILNRNGKLVVRPDCYDEDTQIFTKEGFKFFKDLTSTDEVAQVNDDNTFTFTKPLEIVNQPYEGDMVAFKDIKGRVDLLVTPNHRMVYYNKHNKEIIKYASDMKTKGHSYTYFYRSGSCVSSILTKLTALDRLKIAFQADGSFVTRSNDSIRFSFSKQRKMIRLESILKELDLKYAKYNLKDGRFEYSIKVDSSLFAKNFDWVDYDNIDYIYAREFIEEVSYWDTTKRSNSRFKFDTTCESVAIQVERLAVMAGYGVMLSKAEDNRKDIFSDVFTCHIIKDNKILTQAYTKTDVSNYKGNVYCVKVPTGKIIVKRGKSILVCGNSGDPVKVLCGDPDAPKDSLEYKGSVEVLWDLFGGTLSSTGYKVLDPHIGLIYGDAITPERAEAIVVLLEKKGFASTNVVFGVGSFTYQYTTRDTHGFAMKATWAQIKGVGIDLFKRPKTDPSKNSAKGKFLVLWNNGKLELRPYEDKYSGADAMVTYFRDGKVIWEESFENVRTRANSLIK